MVMSGASAVLSTSRRSASVASTVAAATCARRASAAADDDDDDATSPRAGAKTLSVSKATNNHKTRMTTLGQTTDRLAPRNRSHQIRQPLAGFVRRLGRALRRI